jgi:glycosyltransferase involved in cell wall biosynthesis
MKNKNILFITHTYTTFQKTQIEGIAKYFNQVHVLVRYKPIAEISRLIPIRSLRSHARDRCINLRNTPENVFVYPVPIFYFPFKNSYLRLGDRLYRKCKKIIEKNSIKFDLIHAHYFWTSGYVGIKLKRDYRTPVVITNHSTMQVTKYLTRSATWNEKLTQTITDADHIFVVNKFMKQQTLKVDQEAKVDVIPAGFTEDIFFPTGKEDARKVLGLQDDTRIIVNISSLDDNKNLELFIKGIYQLLSEYRNLLGMIIGDGQNYGKLEKLIRDLGIEKNIKLKGPVLHKEINLWINASDLVALTSFIEGSPTVMYETLACGKPFLGSAVGGIPEIIHSKDYGCIFDPYNVNDFAEKLRYMLETKWDRKKIIEYAENFSQKALSRKIFKVYQNLLN